MGDLIEILAVGALTFVTAYVLLSIFIFIGMLSTRDKVKK